MAVLKNGEHVVLHKDAESVLAVIDAEGKAELLLLANKHGVEAEQAAGLTTKDLRKMLLARFSGLTSA
jgi:acetyl-CoA carboxylase alpha subunit